MTPKEKAKELVDKFTLYLGTEVNGDECYVDIIEAKRCALICVDEMIGNYEEKYKYCKSKQFLEEVKQEINNYDTKRKSKGVRR